MKGLFLFSQLNDVLFMSLDDELSAFINKQARNVSLIDDEAVRGSVDVDIIVHLFSPLIVSQRLMMSELNNPYNSIHCENDMIYVFSQIGDHTAIAIGSTTEEREEYFQRKLLVFRHLLMLFHGPIVKQLHTITPPSDERWNLIRQLLDQWEYLYHEEQCFLMEALEHLSVTGDLNSKCVQLLQTVLSLMKSSGDKLVIHAMIFVQTKLLALYSSRSASELNSGDILLIILAANSLFPWQQQDGTKSTSRTSSQGHGHAGPPSTEHEASETQHKKPATCTKKKTGHVLADGQPSDSAPSSSTSGSENPSYLRSSLLNLDESKYQEWTFLDDVQSDGYWDINSLRLHVASCSRFDGLDRDHRNDDQQHRRQSSHTRKVDGRWDAGKCYKCYRVFLRTKHCCHTPATLHLFEVFPGIVLVFVGELPKVGHAQVIVEATVAVNVVMRSSCKPSDTAVAAVDKALKKLDIVQKQNKNNSQLRRFYHQAQDKWIVAKDIASRMAKELSSTANKNRMESALNGVLTCLENVFWLMYIRGSTASCEGVPHKTVQAIQKKAQEVLLQYRDYLNTKVLQNLTITSYLESFPGLVHFIYVDRNSDYMKAPFLGVLPSEDGVKKHISQTIRHKVWDTVQWLQTKLSAGYTSVMSRDRQLHFSYMVWFEDAMGNPLALEQQYRGQDNDLLPGIISGNFYRKLLIGSLPASAKQTTVNCFELVCVHVGLVPTQYVLSHCRKLAAMLWETTNVSPALNIL